MSPRQAARARAAWALGARARAGAAIRAVLAGACGLPLDPEGAAA